MFLGVQDLDCAQIKSFMLQFYLNFAQFLSKFEPNLLNLINFA